MKESVPTQYEVGERPPSVQEASYTQVCEDLRDTLSVLEEAFEKYPMVTFPNGETLTPTNEAEAVVGKVQRYKEAIDGLLEKNSEGDDREAVTRTEEALRLVLEGVEHLEGFLRVQADLYNQAGVNKSAEDLAEVMRTLAHTLLSEERQHQVT
ncbi:MAG: hypothetical protein KBD21_01305 [Candidatus Pacebacteria bacterium]|nr:hypothetical protein [Candidatus Paceibacterota bacterium]